MKKIFVGIPNTGYLRTELVSWLFSHEDKDKYEVTMFFPQNKPHDYNRNIIVKKFLETDNEYLLMIDSDVVPISNVLEMSDLDKGIMSALVRTYKDGDLIPVALKKVEGGYKVWSPLSKGLNEVDAVGTGCLMIKREVFNKITKPYFRFRYNDEGFLINGEDFDFCDRVKEAGYKVYFNADYEAQHFTTINI